MTRRCVCCFAVGGWWVLQPSTRVVFICWRHGREGCWGKWLKLIVNTVTKQHPQWHQKFITLAYIHDTDIFPASSGVAAQSQNYLLLARMWRRTMVDYFPSSCEGEDTKQSLCGRNEPWDYLHDIHRNLSLIYLCCNLIQCWSLRSDSRIQLNEEL